LLFIVNICATVSIFLADIQTGFLTHSSKSTIKYSGITFKIVLFGISIQDFAISRTLSTSSDVTSSQCIAVIHLFIITPNEEELNETYAQFICSPDIFSASSNDLSKSSLNASISRIFHFLIEFELDSHTPSTMKLFSSSFKKLHITVLILLLHISIEVIILSKFILYIFLVKN